MNSVPQSFSTMRQLIARPIAWSYYDKSASCRRYVVSPLNEYIEEVEAPVFFEFIRSNELTWDRISESYQ